MQAPPVQRLLIDTDPGVDDALAILMAHAQPGVEVLALTTSAGNVGLAHTTANALKLLEVMGAATPVHAGCPVPLVRGAEDAAFVHGLDGFGDTGYAPAARHAEPESAVEAMLRLSRRHPGEIDFVMLGPLTNLALALRVDPQLPSRIRRLVIMGGAVTGRGNTGRLPAEFNIGFDPEAAHIVCSGFARFELVDWEATLRHGVEHERIDGWLAGSGKVAAFYAAISRKTREFMRRVGRERWVGADALAMAVALEPGQVEAWHERPLAVELDGALTRGATVVDWELRGGGAVNARIAHRFPQARFEALLAAALAGD
ncbi:MAG: nucleoside hydrolase [Xanthomonadales bacterium]|nr:nucleoside hydrolase [Xanthomonadales bacterium]